MSSTRSASRATPLLWSFAVALLCVRAADAQRMDRPVLNPTTYTSPSGEYALTVEPGTSRGQGPGSYRMTRRGQVVWSAQHPFTFWEAAVSDDGVAAGYGYQYGLEGFAPVGRGADPKPGNFHVAVFAPDGMPRLNLATPREDSHFLHDDPNPLATGVFIDASQKLLIVRVRDSDINKGGESWWVYELAGGKQLAKAEPLSKEIGLRFVLAVAPVRGTPLVLVNWWHYSETAARNPGAGFSLVDLAAPEKPTVAWSRVLSGDYAFKDAPDDPYQSDRLRSEIHRNGAILRCDEPRRFDLRFVAENQRVSFEVSPGSGKEAWRVREVGRVVYEPPKPAGPAADPPRPVRLRHLGTLALRGPGAPPPPHPVRDISDFDIDDAGRFGLLRRDEREDGGRFHSFVLVDADGKVVVDGATVAPDFGDKAHGSEKVAWVRGTRWVVTDCAFGPDQTARAWFLEVEGGAARVAPLAKFDSGGVESIAGRSDGGFVALSKRRSKYTTSDELTAHGAGGERLWRVEEDSSKEAMLFNPQDLAVDRAHADAVVVLDGMRQCLQLFQPDGKYSRSVALERAFGGKANYPTAVAVQRDGTFVVHDFDGSPPIRRVKGDGSLVDKFEPRFADGQRVEMHTLKLSPDGRIWTTDGERLLRLGADGAVDRSLGRAPDPAAPGQLGAIALGPQGRIYTAASIGAAVQEYDAAGKLVRAIKPDPTDFPPTHDLRELTVSGDGSVYVAGYSAPYVHFRPDGSRVGKEKPTLDTIKEIWQFLPGTNRRWVLGYEAMWLVGEDGKPLREIRQQPDRNWLVHPSCMAVAPDGSAAVVASDSHMGSACRLNVYAADGTAVKTIALGIDGSPSSIAFDGERAVVANASKLLLVDVGKGWVAPIELADGPAAADAYYKVLFAREGKELWVLDSQRKRSSVERYEVRAGE